MLVRDRSRAICEVLSDSAKLQEEREFARQTRDKLTGISSKPSTYDSSQAAAPASGKYGGFGSEDISKFGYKAATLGNSSYDPYVKSNSSVPTQPKDKELNKGDKGGTSEKVTKKSKAKKKKDSDSDSSSNSSSDSSSSEDSDKEDKKKKKKTISLTEAPKASR